MLQELLILYVISFVLGIVIIVRVWRGNTLDGVLTLFIPFYVLYALYKYWGDKDHDIRWPLFAQVIVACMLFWVISHIPPAKLDASYPATAQEQGAYDDDQADDGAAISRSASSAPAATPNQAAASPRAPHAPEPAAEEPPRRATPAELRRLAEVLSFQRGRFVREAVGMNFDIPRGQHLLVGADARRADTALSGENDTHLIAWMIAADKTLTDPNPHAIRIRWRHDGLVATDSAPLDPAVLLAAAQAQPRVPRLSGSGGTLLGYDVAPERQGSTIVWSEERQPEGAATSVFDCHALRLARKGVLEFSIVGADAKAAKSCTDELRALATAVRFDASSDYPAQIQGERVAVYSLVGLITQTQ